MKTKTERVEAAAHEVLLGGRDPSLNDSEQKLYELYAEEVRQGKFEVDGDLYRLDYIKKPPTIDQFILDDYYLGRSWRPIPGENEGIWPAWLELFKTNMDIDSRIHNMVVTGSLGIGKTVMMVTAMLYRICIACHLKNPQNFFGLNRNSNIVYNFLSVTKEAVKDTAFGNAMTYMGDSPYFMEVCRFDPDLEYSSYRIPMLSTLPDGRSSNIWISAGSKGQHVLGRNLCGIGLDEGNFRLEKDPDLKAYELYDQVRTRIANRFQKIASYLPALSVIASSAQDESSFTEKVVHEIEEANRQREKENEGIKDDASKLPVTQMVIRNAVYKIKRHALTGIGPDHHWFRVAYGLKNMEPYILSGWYTEDGKPIETGELHEEPPSGCKTEFVPKFYWEAYRRNCKAQLQNLSGISVGGAHRLFPSLIDIEQCLTYSEQDKVPNPMLPGVQRIPLSAEDNLNIWDSLNHKAFLTRVASRIQPIRHPNNLRYAHIDLATQTLAGLAICHLAGSQLVDGLVKDGQPFAEYRLVVEYDFILTICAGATKPINIEKIQRFFFWLRDMCGYRFGKVTADMWNSAAPLQSLEARSFDVDVLSLDRDKSVYHAWRTGFEEHCIRLHRNEQMLREAVELLEMDKKFDHPPDGCFTGDVQIKLLNGTVPTLKELAETGPSEFWVYASDGNGNVVPALAKNPRKTKTVLALACVTLDNGATVRCTPEHLFMLRDGSYSEAQNLKEGVALMPLHTKSYIVNYQRGRGVYEQVWTDGNWRMTHRVVAEYFGFKPRCGEVIHHVDINPLNNDPANLERLTVAEHNRRHALIAKATSRPEVVEKRRQTFVRRYSNNPEFIAKKIKSGREIWKKMTPAQKQKLRASTQTEAAAQRSRERSLKLWSDAAFRQRQSDRLARYARSKAGRRASSMTVSKTNRDKKNWTPQRLQRHALAASAARVKNQLKWDAKALALIAPYLPYLLGIQHAKRIAGGGSRQWHRRLSDVNFKFNAEKLRGLSLEEMQRLTGLAQGSLSEFLRKLGKYEILKFANHRVKSVVIVAACEDVYDIEVPVYHNFGLVSGVFVHNSKDTTDAAAGAYFNAVNSDEKLTLISSNAPSIYTSQTVAHDPRTQAPMSIPLPDKGYNRSKVFEA